MILRVRLFDLLLECVQPEECTPFCKILGWWILGWRLKGALRLGHGGMQCSHLQSNLRYLLTRSFGISSTL